jgi:putative transposase
MKRYSYNYIKQRRKVARLHAHMASQRSDFLHKQSSLTTNGCDCVAIEGLDMKAMQQALSFGKSVGDNGWGMFTRFLQYKLNRDG